MQKLIDILIAEGKALLQEFEKASSLGEGTSQEVAEFRENALRDFISRFYPLPYRIVKGKVHDSYDNGPSSSVDCIIVNQVHPNLIDSQGKFQLLLADGIDATIELKPDISKSSELIRALKQGVSIKKLRRAKGPILLTKGKPDIVIESSRQIPFYIFTTKIKQNLIDTIQEIKNYYKDNSVPPENQLDGIFVHGLGVLNHIKSKEFFGYQWKLMDDEKVGWYIEQWNDAALAGMLLRLELSFHSIAKVQESVLSRYVKLFKIPGLKKINV